MQPNGGNSSFPKWAIAVIVVLGFFALVLTVVFFFYIMRRLRQRRDGLSHRNSMGSSTPMMAAVDRAGPQSPVMGTAALAGAAGAGAVGREGEGRCRRSKNGARCSKVV